MPLDLRVLGQRPGLRMTAPKDWRPTDLYVAAGDVFSVELPQDLPLQRLQQIRVLVGTQNDKLKKRQKKGSKLRRMPSITDSFALAPGVNKFRSQYGGNLIFVFDEGDNFVTQALVKNVVKAPYFKLGETTERQWMEWRGRDAPLALLESNKVVLCVYTKSINGNRPVANPAALLQRYDAVVDLHNDLAGFGPHDPPPRGQQWFVNDRQISGGSAHAGFPMKFMVKNLAHLDTPWGWGVLHELGHNYQQARYWSYAYGVESTVNLFSSHATEVLFGRTKPSPEKFLEAALAVDRGMTFDESSSWMRLVFLLEIKHAFPRIGWEMIRELNRRVRALPGPEATLLAKRRQAQMDFVYVTLSEVAGQDLRGTYHRWGIPLGHEAKAYIERLGLPRAPNDLSIRSSNSTGSSQGRGDGQCTRK